MHAVYMCIFYILYWLKKRLNNKNLPSKTMWGRLPTTITRHDPPSTYFCISKLRSQRAKNRRQLWEQLSKRPNLRAHATCHTTYSFRKCPPWYNIATRARVVLSCSPDFFLQICQLDLPPEEVDEFIPVLDFPVHKEKKEKKKKKLKKNRRKKDKWNHQ